ncbi:MAG: SDR family NAD(P)-dependent oxidoreductase, partial [Deinococcus sp.]|nr:SDR family NAD(P)-dependent oxidoreductase [Deinococcus sp.]
MLQKKVALVTGASRGIGYAIAKALVQAGAKIGLLARDAGRLRQVEAEFKATRRNGGEVLSLPGDVAHYEDLEAAVERLEQTFGGLDILINNAGVGIFAPVHELSEEQWRQVVDTNLTGVFHGIKAAVPAMQRRGGGDIINIASLAGKNFFAGGAAYNASKFGLLGLAGAAMLDLRYMGIRVVTILPG